MTLKIEFLQLLTPAAQEDIEAKLVEFFNGLGVEAKMENTDTGNTFNALNVEEKPSPKRKLALSAYVYSPWRKRSGNKQP